MRSTPHDLDLDLAGRLRLGITRTARRLRQEAGSHLSPSQSATLNSVALHGPVTPSALATIEQVQRPTITRVLARLEEAGLVARTPDPADGRSCLVSITAAGRELRAADRDAKDRFLARRLETLSDDDRALLGQAAGLLERMLAEGDERR